MIISSDIKKIFKQYQSEKEIKDWRDKYVHDYYYIKEDKYSDVINEILNLMAKQIQEDAVLSAKVKVYEAIIENSNFKMAVKRSEK